MRRFFFFFWVVCLGFHLPVSLFENETLLFDPGPPALGTHPFTRIHHCGGERYEEDMGGFKQICVSLSTFLWPKCVDCEFRWTWGFKTQSICGFVLFSPFFLILYRFSPSLTGILKLHKAPMSCFVSNCKSNWIYIHIFFFNGWMLTFFQNKLCTAKFRSRPAQLLLFADLPD